MTQLGDALYYFFFGEITDGGGHAFEYDDTDGGGWGHAFDSPWWASNGGDFGGSSSSSSEQQTNTGVTSIADVIVLNRDYYFVGSGSSEINDRFLVTSVAVTENVKGQITAKLQQYPYMLVYAKCRPSDKSTDARIALSSQPWHRGDSGNGERSDAFYTSGDRYWYVDTNYVSASANTTVTTQGKMYENTPNGNGVLWAVPPTNYNVMYRIFGTGDSSGGDQGTEPKPPSSGNDDPSGGDPSGGEPTGPTQPTYGGDTYNETTNNYTTIVNNNGVDVDLSPVTSRQDAMKVTLNQIGTDLDTMALRMDADLKAMYKMQVLEVAATTRIYNLLKDIYARLDTLDKSTGDLVDLTTLERYAREISENTVPRTIDFTQFFNHFRTMEGDLDNLDTDLILIGHELGDMTEENGGATLRGIVYGIYELLQDMASDVEDMTSDLELVVQALDNLQDANQLLTVRGYLKGIYDAVTALETGGGSNTDYSGVLGDIYAEVEDIDLNLQAFATAVSDALDGISNDLLTVIRELRNLRIRNPQTPQTPTLPPSDDTLNIDALRDALSRLMQKFPFATINNLIHIMTFLVRDPVAPVFDLPVPNPSDWSQPYMLRVDLSDFSQMAAVMRIGIVLWAIARISRRTVSMWTREEGGSGA